MVYCKERACGVQKAQTQATKFSFHVGYTDHLCFVLCPSMPTLCLQTTQSSEQKWLAPTGMIAHRRWRRTGALGLSTTECCSFIGL